MLSLRNEGAPVTKLFGVLSLLFPWIFKRDALDNCFVFYWQSGFLLILGSQKSVPTMFGPIGPAPGL